MGEVVMSSEGGEMELEVRGMEVEAETPTEKNDEGSAAAPTVVRWEKFLPRMVLRVLLVEADDSTRQIIAALLRKCSYRVVAVPDGLKAWEVLKARPHNIDLILTEVELPSIAGFALLTLTMEHEICKSIPVIMMSSNDSVSTVYKCMLRGAADFLVKPVRKNELRNLWQHVWRRQASTGSGHGPPDESVAQQKVEATAENNDASNHSSGYAACMQRNRERIEKGSDAQSSCTKPDLEVEGANAKNMHDISQPKLSQSFSIDLKIRNENEVATASKDGYMLGREEDMDYESPPEHDNSINQNCDNKHVLGSSSLEVIDLIGSFDNYRKCGYGNTGPRTVINVDALPLLDLSLRRPYPSCSVNQVTHERPRLNHSDASAFSRYVNKASQLPNSTSPSIGTQQKDCETISDKQLSNHMLDYSSDPHRPTPNSRENMIPLSARQTGHTETTFPCPQERVYPVTVPVRGVSLPTAYNGQQGLSPLQSPVSASHEVNRFYPSEPDTQNFQHHLDQNARTDIDQTEHKQVLEDRVPLSSPTDRSASSSFCNGSVGPVNPVPGMSGSEGFLIQGSSHRSTQREAALTKFRLKRKDRCYEKKVRYESRKKLAEQRPRVKGQFVRQTQT